LSKAVFNLYRDAFSGLPRTIWVLCFAGFINRAGTMVLPFLSLYLISQRGFNLNQVGWILMAFGLGSVFGSYIGGKLCNAWNYTTVLIGSLLLSGVGFLVLGSLSSLISLLIGFFFLSMTGDAFRPAIMTAITEHAGKKTTKSMALLRLCINLGMACGPALGGVLASIDYLYLFWADGLTCIAAGFFLIKFQALLIKGKKIGEKTSPISTLTPQKKEDAVDVPFVMFLLLIFALSFAFFQLIGAYPLYLKQVFYYVEKDIGLLLAFNALLIVIFEMVFIHKTQHLSPMHLFAAGLFLMCMGFGLLPLGTLLPINTWGITWFLIFLTMLWTAGEMLSLPLANTIVAKRAEGKQIGTYMGWYTATYSIAMMTAPPAGLFIMEQFGKNSLWWFICTLGVLLPVCALLLKPYLIPNEPKLSTNFEQPEHEIDHP